MFVRSLLLLSFLLGVLASTVVVAQTAGEKFEIRYKLKPGELLVSKVTHFAETKTKMSEHNEDSSSRTTTVKEWDVEAVNEAGEMTFVYRITSVAMAQAVGDAEELTYNSQTDSEVPPVFKQVAETIAKPLATITINPRGQVVSRDNELKAPQLGIGELTIPLPDESIAINGQWSVPRELRVKLESGAFKTIKVRELYTLEKVSAGVATIRIQTQPLTPVNDATVEAQLIQQLSKGIIKFDLDRGRLLSKKLDWSDEVLGFRGPETSLRYDAEFFEELQSELSRTAKATRSSSTK